MSGSAILLIFLLIVWGGVLWAGFSGRFRGGGGGGGRSGCGGGGGCGGGD